MSTTISNTYTGQMAGCNAAAKTVQSQKAGSKTHGAGSEENGVTIAIMDLKTSTPGVTRKEAVKTGFSNVNDYSGYLQEKYSYMNTGTASMQGVPVTVSVSGAFLRKCMDDRGKAAFLEENLAAIPGCVERSVNYTKGMAGNPVMTYCSFSIDANGNITMMGGCTNDPTGKIARENAARKAREAQEARRDAQEAAAEKRAEKKKAEEKAKEEMLRTSFSQTRTLLFHGRDVNSLMNTMMRSLMTNTFDYGFGFDIQA